MSFHKLSSFLLLLCLIAPSCNNKTNNIGDKSDKGTLNAEATASSNKTKLSETTWYITNFTYEGKPYALKNFYSFHIEENSIGLRLDVNTCGFSCSISDKIISIKEVPMCTENCCDSKEAIILTKLLQGELNYTTGNMTLKISNSMGSIHLNAENKGIVGSQWVANSYSYLKGGKEIRFEKQYILSFENTRIRLKLDVNNCNTSCTYNEKASEIELPSGNMGCTRNCCDSKDGELLMQSLQGKISYKKEADKLVLRTNNKEIIFSTFEGSNKNE